MYKFYQNKLNLNNAKFSKIEHNDAIVATVYHINNNAEQYILKISDRKNDFWREIYFLKSLASVIPAPKIIEIIEPEKDNHGAILMEYLPGSLLDKENIQKDLAYDIGLKLAFIHNIKADGYGDPIDAQNLDISPIKHFTSKFYEGLDESKLNLPQKLIDNCQLYYENNVDKLKSVDGPCLIHRDFRPGNIIVHNGVLSGIIDWASGRASFAEEDFCPLEYGEWGNNAMVRKSFLAGYSSVRQIPDLDNIMSLLRISRAIATIGFVVKTGTWNGKCSSLYQLNRKFIEDFLKNI